MGIPITTVLIAILSPRRVIFFLIAVSLAAGLSAAAVPPPGYSKGERDGDVDGYGERRLGRILVVRRRPLFASSPLVLESAACALSISDSLEYASFTFMEAGGV